MTERTELNHIKGKYGQKYAQEIDDWSALLLAEVDEHFDRIKVDVSKSIDSIDKAANAIKSNQRPVHFSDRQQAFYYGLALSLPWSIVAMVTSIFIFWLVINGQEYQARRQLISVYKNAPDYRLLMQNGKIVQEQGANFLELRPREAKGDVLIGREYIFDGKNKRVLVPLGRE